MRVGIRECTLGMGLLVWSLSTWPVQAQLFHRHRCCPPPVHCYPCPPCPEAVPVQPPVPKGKEPEPKKEPPKKKEPAPKVDVPTPPEDFTPPSDFSQDFGSSSLSTFSSSVGYIDNAIPTNMIRLRFDTAYKSNRATRAEFFYARGAPLGPGLPLGEVAVDYQEFKAYAEATLNPRTSFFIEAPWRFLNPIINDNSSGYGDMTFGLKRALVYCPGRVTTFQLRAFVPTGDSSRGLGTDHASLEPALLVYRQLSRIMRVEGELRYWIPIGGTDFAGDVVRYGIGVSVGERYQDSLWTTPVLELVGWTVVDGAQILKEAALSPPIIQDASGDTIINAKLGVRTGAGNLGDFYIGYGRALTGEVWYKNIWRAELRIRF